MQCKLENSPCLILRDRRRRLVASKIGAKSLIMTLQPIIAFCRGSSVRKSLSVEACDVWVSVALSHQEDRRRAAESSCYARGLCSHDLQDVEKLPESYC